MTLRKTLAIAIAVAVICCFTVSNRLVAATAPMVTYTASGTFASPATSGADTLKLAGEPFSVSISASAASEPFEHGSNWGAYDKLKLTGSVHSGLLGTTPVNIASSEATIIQAIDPGQYDTFTMEAPVQVVGISLTIKAVIVLPLGTIANPYLHPFSAIALAPGNSTVTYSDSSASTVLAIQTGGLTATIPSGDPRASAVVLHSGGAEAVTTHADGTASVRSIGAAPVDLGASTDAVALKFYAYGVSGASEVHVQMGGEEVPLLYAAASGYFPGLDEVMVKVPRSFAGRGATEVTLTVDGQTAAPVHIQIQ
jgi:hypothetical protein